MRPRFGTKAQAFSGEGARLFGGRWNAEGRAVVYTSSSLSLAALETLAHADKRRFERNYVVFRLELPQDLITSVADEELPDDWQARVSSLGARALGERWLLEGSAVLEVPSVIVPLEKNYLLNPQHEDFGKITIGPPQTFKFDARL